MRDLDNELDLLFRQIDDLLCGADFVAVDAKLRGYDVEEMPTDLIIGVLSITYAARTVLEDREAFFFLAEKVLEARAGAEETAALLFGLK